SQVYGHIIEDNDKWLRETMQYNRATAAIFIIHLLVVAGVQNAAAQEAKGVVLCLAACSKSDKACQDRCVPASVGSKGTACIEKCRRRASEPDLVAKMYAWGEVGTH
ncbi:MAG: hypothetical protein WCF79_22705, partial [Rhodomicrobium sp.]